MQNNKKPYLLVDSSYVSFHRFFSTLIWYSNVYPHNEINDDYDWSLNEVFMKHFDDTYMKNLVKFKNMYNVPNENMLIIRDCPRETIWRMNIYPEYKGTRKNVCTYKNKKYNIGNIFRHIYGNLYPRLEKIHSFKILKVENAEADDIIAILSNKIREMDKNRLVVIISNDNDYLQLVNEKTLIWSLQNKLLNTKVEMTAEEILLKKILKGDECDNIPSIVGNMSDHKLNELVKDSKKLQEWLIQNNKDSIFHNNQKLIDFKYIPDLIKSNITQQIMDTIPEIKENISLNIEFPVTNNIFLNLPKEFWKEPDELKVKSMDGYHYIKKCKYNKYFDYLHYITENYYF
jgi:5'-3' exonuclease